MKKYWKILHVYLICIYSFLFIAIVSCSPIQTKKNSEISEDDLKKILNEVQKLTDNSIEKIDELLKVKKEDILKV